MRGVTEVVVVVGLLMASFAVVMVGGALLWAWVIRQLRDADLHGDDNGRGL